MIDPIMATGAVAAQMPAASATVQNIATARDNLSFEQLLRAGIDITNAKLVEADRLVTAFTLDNDIPAHQVTFALEEARLSLEMMIQVRNRLVEGYQQIMNMQV